MISSAPLWMQPWLNAALVLLAVLLIDATPLRRPFKWAETFYHELSHGLAAIVTGGRINRLVLRFDGSGVCIYQPGQRAIIIFMGYAGAALWGGLLYLIGTSMSLQAARVWLIVELTMIAIVFFCWVDLRDVQTRVILLFIAGIYLVALYLPQVGWLPWLLRVTGLYVLVSAIRAPLIQLRANSGDDASAMQALVWFIPRAVWIAVWVGIGLATLAYCFAKTPGLLRSLGFR
jgi:hypothetical protein